MNKKTLKTIATGAAITIAAVGTPAFAEETTPTVETTNDAVVSKNETTAVELPKAPKTAADVKPALDAQQAVVDATTSEATQAQADADTADQAVATAEADVATATQAVSDAEVNAANATPANIEANQADQTANLADQEANATETDEVNAEIASQTQTVADAQTAVDTAQAEKDQADATVTAKEADVKSAQDAISGTGLAEAQDNLDQAVADVKTAETNVATATDAVATAKQADADRQTKIDTATTDVAVKSDAVDTSKAVLTKAQDNVASTTVKLAQTTDAVTKAQDALSNVDTVTIADLTQFKADKAEGDSDFMTDSGATVIEQSSTKISENDKSDIVTIGALTSEQQQKLSLYAAQVLSDIRTKLGINTISVTDAAMKAALDQANKYVARNQSVGTAGHLAGDYTGENVSLLNQTPATMNMYNLKQLVYQGIMGQTFADAPSDWGHMKNNLKGNHLGLAVANVDGQMHIITVIQIAGGTVITNPEDPTVLQAALVQAQADQAQAQAASDAAKAQLTKASSDYATALEVKTAAEKVLAEATATPLQTQVAENNLRLAKIALTNAQTRQADAQQAVDNFSADLATKKAALDEAKAKLADAQAVQVSKATALDAAKAELTKQEATLASLNAEKEALLAEKDRLVEEAKALATELKGYLEAGTKLEEAKVELSEKETTLKDALAKAAATNTALETINAKLAEEKAKLAELQAEYDKLKDLEDKAKDNVIATLPDGTIVAVPKDAPTTTEKPVININAVKQALDKGQDVKVVDGKVVVTNPQAGVTVPQTATGEKVTYSRVERAKTLPNTGEQTSLALALLGLTNLLGVAVLRRNK